MNRMTTIALTLALSAAGFAHAQAGAMKGMDMKGMDMQKCHEMMGTKDGGMKGMDMKGMDMQKCQEMMGSNDKNQQGKGAKATTHQADGVVKAIDTDKNEITLAHGAVKSLDWPPMTMAFSVKDKSLLDKLTVGQKVHVQFVKQGTNYIVTSVK